MRLKTRKYSSEVMSKEMRDLLRKHTRYDQEVYDFARNISGRAADPFLYETYGEFMASEGWPSAAALLACLAFGCLCCRRCYARAHVSCMGAARSG